MRRLLAALVILIGLAAQGHAAVTLDSCGTEQISSNAVTSFDYTGLTVGGLTNGALVLIFTQVGVLGISAVTADWDHAGTPQSQFAIGNANSALVPADQVFIFGLRNPTSGNKTAHIAWTTNGQVTVIACSFSGVEQSSDANAFKNFNSAVDAAAISVTITSATGDAVMGIFGSGVNFTSTNQTQLFIDNSGTAWAAAGNRAAGAATVTLTGNPGQGTNAVAAGVDIVAAAAAAATCPSRALLGVGC